MNGLTPDEWKTHFSLWAISAAPLWAGIDLRKMTDTARDVFLNKEVIAIDQDPLGIAARKVDSRIAAMDHPGVSIQLCEHADVWTYNNTDLTLRSNHLCASIEDCSTKAGGKTIMWECVGSAGGCPKNQMYDVINNTHSILFSSKISNMCLTATDKQAKAIVVQQSCDKSNDLQQWIQSGHGNLQLLGTDLCMSIGGGLVDGEVWYKRLSAPSSHSAVAVLFFNPNNDQSANVTLNFKNIGLDSDRPNSITLHDLWQHTDLPPVKDFSYSAKLSPHQIQFLKITQT